MENLGNMLKNTSQLVFIQVLIQLMSSQGTQAGLDHVVLLHLHTLTHCTKRAFNPGTGALGVEIIRQSAAESQLFELTSY